MIEYHYETDFKLGKEDDYSVWIEKVINGASARLGPINYIFTSDRALHKLNLQFLKHDTFTDILTFDYSEGGNVSGDIYISIERVEENATLHAVDFHEELLRVMVHGILHLLGYEDKGNEQQAAMRLAEEMNMKLFHVER